MKKGCQVIDLMIENSDGAFKELYDLMFITIFLIHFLEQQASIF